MLEFSTFIRNQAPEGFPAQLEVRVHMFGGWGVGEKGEMLVTPWLNSAAEVDCHMDQLISALERLRVEAKAKLEENECS